MELCGRYIFSILNFLPQSLSVLVYALVRGVGLIGLARRMVSISMFEKSHVYFKGCTVWRWRTIKDYCFRSGSGFGIGSLIITVLAKEL